MLPIDYENLSGMFEIPKEKAEMHLLTSKKTKYDLNENKIDFPLESEENNLKVVTINDYENDNSDSETKDCENKDSSVSEPEYYYYYYYDYIDSDKETQEESFEPLPHHL